MQKVLLIIRKHKKLLIGAAITIVLVLVLTAVLVGIVGMVTGNGKMVERDGYLYYNHYGKWEMIVSEEDLEKMLSK